MDSTSLLMIALFVALGYFMLVRPAQQQKKKQAALMSELEPGARVTTQIGVYGTLVELGEVLARVEVAPGVVMTVDKRLVSGVVPRSRDEFWTYPEEPAAEAIEDAEQLPADSVEDEQPVSGEPAADLQDAENAERRDNLDDDRKA